MDLASIENLIKHYKNSSFQQELKTVRNDLSSHFIDLIEYLRDEHLIKKEQLIISAPEARVKSPDRLKEKIIRNIYFDEWGITPDLEFEDCKKIILARLPDAIGLRINCYFYDDEKELFEKILTNEKIKQFLAERKIELEDDKKEIPETSITIYKYNGTYKYQNNVYKFELQLKSIVHSMWGEVDHKTIYKEEKYDINRSLKKDLEFGIFGNLRNSSKQLSDIYLNEYSDKDLIKALFFEYSKDKIAEAFGTSFVQSRFYYQFYNVFHSDYYFDQIKIYVGSYLLPENTYTPIDIKSYDFSNDKTKEQLCEQLFQLLLGKKDDKVYSYMFRNFTEILKCLFSNISEENMLKIIASIIVEDNYNEADFIETSNADFSTEEDDEEDTKTNNSYEQYINDYLNYFDKELSV